MSDKTDAALALSVAALVPSIFGTALPNLTDVRSTPDVAGAQQQSLRAATAMAAVVVVVASAVTGSRMVLVVGGVSVIAQALAYGLAVPLPNL